MNIIVRPYGRTDCYCRPDTTWERENKDFYVPDHVEQLLWTPVVFVRISKAGKCIGEKFASRYHDALGFGVLMYTGNGDVAFTSCADHTSLLPAPKYDMSVMENDGDEFVVTRNGSEIFRGSVNGLADDIRSALCKASGVTTLRIGDYLAVELAQSTILAERGCGEVTLKADFGADSLTDLKIIF